MQFIGDRLDSIACQGCGQRVALAQVEPLRELPCPHCGFRLIAPALLDQFRLTKLVHQGSNSAVYEAVDRTLDRRVAIKVVSLAEGEAKRLEQWLDDARALASLHQENLAAIYHLGSRKGLSYVAMQWVEGDRLDRLMSSTGAIDEMVVLRIMIHVARGLKAAAAAGIVHGQVSPVNILLEDDGPAKIIDFNSVTLRVDDASAGPVGSTLYVAPEQVRGQPADIRADIYSLGGVMFHALAGRPPFTGGSTRQVQMARLKRRAADVRLYQPQVCAATSQVIARLLEADPQQRYPDYAALIRELEAAAKQVHSEPVEPDPVAELQTALEQWRRRSAAARRGVVANPGVPRAVESDAVEALQAMAKNEGGGLLGRLARHRFDAPGDTSPMASSATGTLGGLTDSIASSLHESQARGRRWPMIAAVTLALVAIVALAAGVGWLLVMRGVI